MDVLSGRVILRPADLERSLHFYGETLGLHVYREYGTGPQRGVVFFIGGGYLEVTGSAPAMEGDKVSLWLQVPSLDEVHSRLRTAAVTIVDPPQRKPWGLL
ncbi:MAG: VOC family protein, partial [Acidimicrobiia bacterium]|nr:VOC family protein [Acidimicrobiia bacterium]